MHNSIISSAHHYYSLLLRIDQIKDKSFIKTVLSSYKNSSIISSEFRIYHLQEQINKTYGSEEYLERNKVTKNGIDMYWYDFYLGLVELDNIEHIYLCYPYKALEVHLQKKFPTLFQNSVYYVPDVNLVLEHTKKNSAFNTINKNTEVLVDVIKYSAEVLGQDNTDKVNLVGSNPQDSEIYAKLNELFAMYPSSVKLRFSKNDLKKNKQLDLIFDRLGNFRFWIPKNQIENSIESLSIAFQYLAAINSLKKAIKLSKYQIIDES